MRVLILGGTAQARELAAALDARGIAAVTSLAGKTAPATIAGETRIGGFGGPHGLARYLEDRRVDALVDATHPFAATMSANAVQAALLAGTPLVRLERPRWQRQHGDRWHRVPTLEAAAGVVATLGARVFLTMGDVAAFAPVDGAWFLIRCINPPAVRPPHHELVLARGPFTLAQERAALRRHRIDLLVTKDSGGAAPKLQAARDDRVPVLMIDRPPTPAAPTVRTPHEAVQWIVSRSS